MLKFVLLIFIISYAADVSSKTFSSQNVIQEREQTPAISHNCTLVTSSRIIYKDVKLSGLKDSTIKILKDEVETELSVNDIRTITFSGRGFLKGLLIGSGVGFVTGLAIGGSNLSLTGDGGNHEYSLSTGIQAGFILAIPFGLIGGGLGSLFAEDKFYDLSNMDFDAKRKKLKILIRDNSGN